MAAGEQQSHIGCVKSFNHTKGWGFIECPETHAQYGTDVFLLRGQIVNNTDIGKGDQVSFCVVQGERGVQAANVQVLQSASSPDGQPAAVQGPYKGTIKHYNHEKGFGFLSSADTDQLFGKDVFFMKSELPPAGVPDGTELQFYVRMNEKGPQATRIQLPGQFGKGGGYGKGGYGKGDYGKGGYGYDYKGDKGCCKGGKGYGDYSYGKGGGCYGKDGYGCQGGGGMGYDDGYWGGGGGGYGGGYGGGGGDYGCGGGYGGGGMDGSGWDGGMNGGWGGGKGEWGMGGGGMGGMGMGGMGGMCGKGGGGYGGCAGGKGGGPQAQVDSQVYFGTIKFLNAEKGWGHIACDAVETAGTAGKDVFVMKSNMDLCPGVQVGAPVMFNVSMGPKGPHGVNIRPAPQSAQALQTFMGVVRSYSAQEGQGIVDCAEASQIFESEIYLRATELNGSVPSQGEQISFTVDTSSGRPAAANIVLASGGGGGCGGQGYSAPQMGQQQQPQMQQAGGYGPMGGNEMMGAQQYSPY